MHATFQRWHFAGKRSRFRETNLWLLDKPSYYSEGAAACRRSLLVASGTFAGMAANPRFRVRGLPIGKWVQLKSRMLPLSPSRTHVNCGCEA